MHNLKISRFDPSVLEHATLIPNERIDRFFDVYDLNNGMIMKVVRSYDEINRSLDGFSHREIVMDNYEMIMSELLGKLKRSGSKELPDHVLPQEIQMHEGMTKSYIVSKVSSKYYVEMAEYFKSISLEEFKHIMILLSEKVKKANKQGVYMPDLGNLTNVFINPNSCSMRFIDYDGMQIDDFKTVCASTLINTKPLPIAGNERFFDPNKKLFKPNIDILSLYSIFLLYTTRTRLMSFGIQDYYLENGVIRLRESSLREHVSILGLAKTEFEDALFELFFGENPEYPGEHIKKLLREYTLIPYKGIRRFEKM